MQRLFPSPGTGVRDDELFDAAAAAPGTDVRHPFVRFSMVASLDARISSGGVSAPLSSAADQRRFLILRSVSDAVVVGAGTAVAEGYAGEMIPVAHQVRREAAGLPRLPSTVVLSASASVPPDAPVFTDAPAPTFVVVSESADAARVRALSGALGREGVITVPGDCTPKDITAALAARGLAHLHHEGGPTILGRYVAADAVDSLCLSLTPSLVTQGPGLTGSAVSPHPRGFVLHSLFEEDSVLLADYRREADA